MTALVARLRNGPPRWLPAVAVLVMAAAGAALGRTGSMSAATASLVTAGLGAFALVMACLSPPLGLIAFVAGAMTSPLELATGTQSPVPFAVMAAPLLAGICALDALRRDDHQVWRVPAVRAAGALAAAALLAAAVGNLPWFGFGQTAPARAQIGGIAVYALTAAVFIVGADQLRDARWLRRLVCVYFAVAAVMIGGWLIPEMRTLGEWLLPRRTAGSLTWTWFAALGSAQVLFNTRLNWRWRLLLGMAVASELYVGMQIDREWLAGWVPALTAILAVICIGTPRLGAAVVAVGALGVALNLPGVIARLSAGDNLYSLSTRLDAWAILLKIIARNPIVGLGPANYYQITPLFPIRGYAVHFSSHNTYVDLVAQTGIVGLACFAWLAWAIGRAGWRARARPPGGFTRAYVIGALGGLAGTLVAGALGDWVFPFVYNVSIAGLRSSLPAWLFLGGLVAVGRQRPP